MPAKIQLFIAQLIDIYIRFSPSERRSRFASGESKSHLSYMSHCRKYESTIARNAKHSTKLITKLINSQLTTLNFPQL